MSPASETRPSPALAQHRLSLLRGAACYAELALLAGTWTTTGIEASLDGKGVGTQRGATSGEGTRKYARYLLGAIPSEKTINAISKKHGNTALRFWTVHPIGQLLTDGDISVDTVLRLLEMLPAGIARSRVWDESPEALARSSFRREVPDDTDTIDSLADLRTTDAFLALLGRHRLRRLMGQTEFDDVYEFALMGCFAAVVGSCPHLCLAKHVLVPAFADYLEWPFGDSPTQRPIADLDDGSRAEYWDDVAHQIDRARMEAELRGISMPSKKYIEDLKHVRPRRQHTRPVTSCSLAAPFRLTEAQEKLYDSLQTSDLTSMKDFDAGPTD
ncbi:hypothetical protein [Lysobacter enzymogenes]|uniref:hypothetical protein n=1 Tax=Lysobacter enzymogenes TaxID=69 RepID=UPI00089841E5|nr:hypothetical protein [Lysobacter enzymogenes]SDX70717.1 hypothetical protein SAMN05421681_10775 [Lysobacter enzymogenes]